MDASQATVGSREAMGAEKRWMRRFFANLGRASIGSIIHTACLEGDLVLLL